jgi:hypothetical protein
MKRILNSKAFQWVGAVCQLYVGLGWWGVIGGFTNTDTIVSRIGGAIWLLSGIAALFSLFRRPTPNKGAPANSQ